MNGNVNTVDVYPSEGDYTDVIYNVHWRLNATDTQVDAKRAIPTQHLFMVLKY